MIPTTIISIRGADTRKHPLAATIMKMIMTAMVIMAMGRLVVLLATNLNCNLSLEILLF